MRTVRRLLLVALLIAAAAAFFLARRGLNVTPGSVLVLDVEGGYIEAAEPPLLMRVFGERRTPLLRLYSELRKAERDARLHAVVLRIRKTDMGWAKAQEVRDALARMREAGRRTVAYLEVEPIGANVEYYIASAAEKVYIAPGSRVPFVGLVAEYLFLGGLFDKFGVDLEVERVGPHKTAADMIAGRSMSEPHREMANWILDSVYDQFVSGIASARGLSQDEVRHLIDAAPSSPAELVEAKLVDGAAFFSDVLKELGAERPVLEADDWARVDPKSVGFQPVGRVALVYGSGTVMTGRGDRVPGGAPVLASQTVSEAIEEAAKDPTIDAILFRIDSPGGSALASDLVWHATQVAQREKPVVVSFSDVAASGGYYVACGADAIVAQPGTLTGSIGVLSIRPVVRRVYEKLGIGFELLQRGEHAEVFASSAALDEVERKRMGDEIERTYQLFLDRVVAGRGIEREKLDELARGRVWTGAQAAERGLVDGLGGLHAAVARVRGALKLAPDADLELVVFPPPKPLSRQLAEQLRGAAAMRAPALPLPRELRSVLSWLEAVPPGAPALLPPIAVEVY